MMTQKERDDLKMAIGTRLRDIRKDLGVTAKDMMAYFNCKNATISRYEHGKGGFDLDVLIGYSDRLGVPIATLVDLDDDLARKLSMTMSKMPTEFRETAETIINGVWNDYLRKKRAEVANDDVVMCKANAMMDFATIRSSRPKVQEEELSRFVLVDMNNVQYRTPEEKEKVEEFIRFYKGIRDSKTKVRLH